MTASSLHFVVEFSYAFCKNVGIHLGFLVVFPSQWQLFHILHAPGNGRTSYHKRLFIVTHVQLVQLVQIADFSAIPFPV